LVSRNKKEQLKCLARAWPAVLTITWWVACFYPLGPFRRFETQSRLRAALAISGSSGGLLAAVGRKAIEREARERRRVIEETAGLLTGVYRSDELERLREDWPE